MTTYSAQELSKMCPATRCKILFERLPYHLGTLKNRPSMNHSGLKSQRHKLSSRNLNAKLRVAIIATRMLGNKLTDYTHNESNYSTLWRTAELWYSHNQLNYLSDFELDEWVKQAFKLGLTRLNRVITNSNSTISVTKGRHYPASTFMLAYKKWNDLGLIRYESNRSKRHRIFAGLGKAAAVIAV